MYRKGRKKVPCSHHRQTVFPLNMYQFKIGTKKSSLLKHSEVFVLPDARAHTHTHTRTHTKVREAGPEDRRSRR